MTRLTIPSALAIAGLVAIAHAQGTLVLASPITMQEQAHEEHHPAGAEQPAVQAQESQMMAKREQMMTAMKATDARIDALLTRMNAATGEGKVEAMAELVAALVQRRTMGDGMMQMQGEMMGHMMQHMSAGMSPEMKKMAECPMMKMMTPDTGK